jgi:UDP-N-acetylmuramate: L-alanyl-gamma-D-glutamyl-meso-diaminopimelate ligase
MEDPVLQDLVKSSDRILDYIPYREHPFDNAPGGTELIYNGGRYPVGVFGRHNMQNISAARTVCELLGISHEDFYAAIGSFRGAGRRMQLLGENGRTAVYLDFAHAPSKVMSTTSAMKDKYPERHLVAVLELHTFSSLNTEFLPRYVDSMEPADTAIVYYNPKTVKHKKLPEISSAQIKSAFRKDGLMVYTDADKLMGCLAEDNWTDCNLLIMTSGNFDGQDLEAFAARII